MVDEYQDVSPLQQRLLDLWLGERDSLCVVGDASQTIYSFTGATPDHLLDFRTRHPGATVVKLVRDYRSSPQVVHLANGLLAQARGRAAEHRLELISQRSPGPEPVYAEYTDEPAEAEGAARRIRDLIASGVPAGEIAILFRTNSQSELYEQALADAGVPYQLRGAERFFDRPEVRKAGAALRAAARFGGNDSLLDDVIDLPSQVRAVLSGEGWTNQPPAGSGAVRERWESLAALVHLAHDFAAAKQGATLGDLVAELDERASAQHAPTVQGVTLASLHSAKGLEWDVVFLVAVAEGMMPITYAKTDEQIEEERRLLYVGVTRAREHLGVSWALSRSPGGRPNRRPSRFLDGLRPGSVMTAGRSSGGGGPGGIERGIGSSGGTVVRRSVRTPCPLPGLRPHPDRRGRDETDALRGLSLRHGRGPLRAVAGVAGGAGTAQWAARVLRLHRQDLDGDRRDRARRRGRAGQDPWRRSPQAEPLRHRCSGHLRRSRCWRRRRR